MVVLQVMGPEILIIKVNVIHYTCTQTCTFLNSILSVSKKCIQVLRLIAFLDSDKQAMKLTGINTHIVLLIGFTRMDF
jgi:hypothetical protein